MNLPIDSNGNVAAAGTQEYSFRVRDGGARVEADFTGDFGITTVMLFMSNPETNSIKEMFFRKLTQMDWV